MAEPSTIRFVPTGDPGPEGGRLQLDSDRIEVVTGFLRHRVHLTRSIWDLRDCGAASPAHLAGIEWLTTDARGTLDRLAAEDPSAMLLALRFGSLMGDETWLFRGQANSIAYVARSLRDAIVEIRSGERGPDSAEPNLLLDALAEIAGIFFP